MDTAAVEKTIGALERTDRQADPARACLSAHGGCVSERSMGGGTTPEGEALLQAVWDTAVDGIVTIDEHGIVQSFNPAAERIFGYRAGEVVGQNVSMLMPMPHRGQHDEYIRRYLETGTPHIIGIGREVVGLRKDKNAIALYLAVSKVNVANRIWFAGIVRDISRHRKTEEAIVSTSEQVRRVIGQDLHDELGQLLAGIALLAKTLEKKLGHHDDSIREMAVQITELAQHTMTEAKRLAQGLYPTALEKHGLSAALEELADTIQHVHGIECDFQAVGEMEALGKSRELHLYRIAQEAANNAAKHAEPKSIRIRLDPRDGALKLTVEDDGVGFSSQREDYDGMGLNIMRHRASMIGASLDIVPVQPRGTRVQCALPIIT